MVAVLDVVVVLLPAQDRSWNALHFNGECDWVTDNHRLIGQSRQRIGAVMQRDELQRCSVQNRLIKMVNPRVGDFQHFIQNNLDRLITVPDKNRIRFKFWSTMRDCHIFDVALYLEFRTYRAAHRP